MPFVEVQFHAESDAELYPGRLVINDDHIVWSRREDLGLGVYKTTIKMMDGSSFVLKGNNSRDNLFLIKI